MTHEPPILALDPATTTGWAVWSGGESIASGCWHLDGAGPRPGARLWGFYQQLMDAQREHGMFSMIASEDSMFGVPIGKGKRKANPDTLRFHAQLKGVIEMIAYRINAQTAFYKPASIKAFAGSGRYTKQQMISAAKRWFGFVPVDDNEADALFVLAMARQNYQPATKPKRKGKAPKARRKEMLF